MNSVHSAGLARRRCCRCRPHPFHRCTAATPNWGGAPEQEFRSEARSPRLGNAPVPQLGGTEVQLSGPQASMPLHRCRGHVEAPLAPGRECALLPRAQHGLSGEARSTWGVRRGPLKCCEVGSGDHLATPRAGPWPPPEIHVCSLHRPAGGQTAAAAVQAALLP